MREEELNLRGGGKGFWAAASPRHGHVAPRGAAPPRCHRKQPWSGDLIAKHLKHKGRELHAALRLEGEAAVLLGVLLVEATQVSQLLDHLGIEQMAARGRVAATDIGLQRVGQAILDGLDQCSILHPRTVCGHREVGGGGTGALSQVSDSSISLLSFGPHRHPNSASF